MSCGNTSCPDHIGLGDHVELGGAGMASGLLQVMPEDFTRTELHKLLDRTRDLSQYGIFNDTKRELLIDLEETLDLLDALAAREELDILHMETAIQDTPTYFSRPRPDSFVHVTHKLPRCGPDCPLTL